MDRGVPPPEPGGPGRPRTDQAAAWERFGLTQQMRRAAVWVPSNIAEGCSRSSRAGFARFVEMAGGSVFEVVSQASICQSQGYLGADDFQELRAAAERQSRMLSGLRASLRNS